MAERTHAALILSAGAPHSSLMAGALCALHERGKTFDIIYTSGAGVLIGLLLVAPRGKEPEQALRDIVELGIADPIYRLFPVNYKAFVKPGPFTQPMRRLARRLKLGGEAPFRPIARPVTPIGHLYNAWIETWSTLSGDGVRRLYNDLVDLWAAALTPTTLSFFSQGLCEQLPFLEEIVDFDRLRRFPGEFYINAFNVTDERMEVFGKDAITPEHVRAAFAYPFIYRPGRLDGKIYFEGADRDPLSFGQDEEEPEPGGPGRMADGTGSRFVGVVREIDRGRIRTVILLDILDSLERDLLREPRNLWDAYGISIMTPVVALAKRERKQLEAALAAEARRQAFEYINVPFRVPGELAPQLTDWSYSNLARMFAIGYEQGQKVWPEHHHRLPDRRHH
jgi:predicted acylesterase/phospholipase RssA